MVLVPLCYEAISQESTLKSTLPLFLDSLSQSIFQWKFLISCLFSSNLFSLQTFAWTSVFSSNYLLYLFPLHFSQAFIYFNKIWVAIYLIIMYHVTSKHCRKVCEIQRYTALFNAVKHIRVTLCISPYLD